MARSGSENRQKTRSVLVRLTEAQHSLLTVQAAREGASCAEFLRRRMSEPTSSSDIANGGGDRGGLTETDRILLARATRTMGHMAGLMKLAVVKLQNMRSTEPVRTVLDDHRQELQYLQGQVRSLLERVP